MAKIKQQLPPGLKTRAKNKETHPAQAAGVTPKPRRTQKEAEDNRRQLAQAKQDKKAADLASKARVAEIEDRLREEDAQRDATANRPPRSTAEAFRPPKPNLRSQMPAFKKKASISPVQYNDISDESGDEYMPPPAPENKETDVDTDTGEDDSEGEDEVVDDEEQEEPGRRGRNKNPRRSDISNLRRTDVASGTPVNGKRKAEDATSLPLKKNKNTKKQNAFVKNWSTIASVKSSAVEEPCASTEEDDSMVRMGGFLSDTDDRIEQAAIKTAQPGGPRGRKALPSIIKIENKLLQPVSKKEARGGKAKWGLEHLPAGTSKKFTDEVAPLAIQKAGTLVPWSHLSTEQIQAIVDRVYGPDEYEVQFGDVWTDLISYRLNNWRNGFRNAAEDAVASYFKDSDHQDVFKTKDDIKECVEWFLQFQGPKLEESAPYQWQEWLDVGHKKGFCQSGFIIHTFAFAHLNVIPERPSSTDPVKNLPVGALILSLQAVERALREYEMTGTKISGPNFAFQHWGDHKVREEDENGHWHHVFKPRASRYIATVEALKPKHWKSILDSARDCLLALPSKRGKKSRSMSRETEEDEMAKAPVFILLSDGSSSSSDEDGATDRLQETPREPVKPATSHSLKNHATGSEDMQEGEGGRASSSTAASDDDVSLAEAE